MSRKENPEELDMLSPNFNPLKALYSDITIVPCPKAQVYDNISCFIETPDGVFPKPPRKSQAARDREKRDEAGVSREPSTSKQLTEGIGGGDKRAKKIPANVLTRMENTVKGPLTFLKKCMDEKLRIKVHTRGPVSPRGYCIGFIEAFDKHLNLVLKDVFERWSRKKRGKIPCSGPVGVIEDETREKAVLEDYESNLLKSCKYVLHKKCVPDRKTEIIEHSGNCSKTIVRERSKRREVCERHVHQLLIRGEQIVIITLESSPS